MERERGERGERDASLLRDKKFLSTNDVDRQKIKKANSKTSAVLAMKLICRGKLECSSLSAVTLKGKYLGVTLELTLPVINSV